MKKIPLRMTLEQLVPEVLSEIRRLNYSKSTIGHYRHFFDQILAVAHEEDTLYFSKELKDKYLLRQFNYPKERHGDLKGGMRAIHTLEFFAQNGYFSKRIKLSESEYPNSFVQDLEQFKNYLRNQNLSPGTVKLHLKGLDCFACYLLSGGIYNFSDIRQSHISGYVLSLTKLSKETVRSRIYSLRTFLRFAAEAGMHKISLEKCIPKLTCPRGEHLATTWTMEETEKILAAADRGSPTGKRDYAILLLAARLGIRASDIIALKLADIKWEHNCIEFTQAKTRRSVNLPLSSEVGMAIVDYLKYGRPKSDYPNVFIRHVVPYEPLTTIYAIMEKHVRLSGVDYAGKKCGTHTFRHSLVSRLLEKSTPYPVVSGILGHHDPNTTKKYTHVAIEQLRSCALDLETVMDYA